MDILHRIKLQREIISEYPEFIQFHLFGPEQLVYKLCGRIMRNDAQYTLTLMNELNIDIKAFVQSVFDLLSQESPNIESIEGTLQSFAEIKKKGSASQKAKLAEFNVRIIFAFWLIITSGTRVCTSWQLGWMILIMSI